MSRPRFILPGGSAADRAALSRAWGRLSLPLRDAILGAGIRGRCLAQDERFCDVATTGSLGAFEGSWGLFLRDERRILLGPGASEGVALHELGHAVDFACGPGRLYASDSPAYGRHFAQVGRSPGLNDYAALDPQEHFAEAFRLWHGVGMPEAPHRTGDLAHLVSIDAATAEIISGIMRDGVWEPGRMTWPDAETRRRAG